MIYLSGCVRADLPKELGVMITPMTNYRTPPDRLWASDNGCFAQPAQFDPVKYLAWLVARRDHVDRCLFATAPDVMGDAKATLIRSTPFLAILRAIGYPAALVAQDGIDAMAIPWDTFDVLFIGGTDAWKFTAKKGLTEAVDGLIQEAKQRGKWVHAGRVNSYRRLRTMQLAHVDSTDGNFIRFGPTTNIPRLEKWLAQLERQPVLQ